MKKADQNSLSEFVYTYLKEQILRKKILCGERISESKIHDELDISRTPIREAVRRLATEGIVELVPNCYAKVITFDENSIKELGLVRISMDSLSAQLAVVNGSNRDFDTLKELVESCSIAHQQGDWYHQIEYDGAFHLRLIEISGNSVLLNLQKNIMFKTRLLQTYLIDENSSELPTCALDQHQKILDALYARDTDKAIKAIVEHLAPFYLLENEQVQLLKFNQL